MREGTDALRELDALGSKVYQAKELIGRLRRANRELASKLAEAEGRRQGSEPVPTEATKDHEISERLEHLQNERREIRRRVSTLLQKIEALDI